MKILLTGATGFVGTTLALKLSQEGHQLSALSRNTVRGARQIAAPCEMISWDLMKGPPPSSAVSGVDAVIHLMGESIAGKRWTPARKKAIYDSRIIGTRHLVQAIQSATVKPPVLISASAIGIYGNRKEETLTESSTLGSGFLVDVCRDWEKEAQNARSSDTRVVCLRFGVILGKEGGALAQMKGPFGKGLGATLGSGEQFTSWIHLEDAVAAIRFILLNKKILGAVNATAPEPVTNRVFTQALAKALHAHAYIHAPALLLRLAMGELSGFLLDSARVMPEILQKNGFEFQHPTLEKALSEACVIQTS